MNALFAQFGPQGGGGGQNPNPFGPGNEAFLVVMGVALCIGVTIGIAITVFFLLSLSKALKRCSPDNRTMEPAMVWLNLIPLFSMFWIFLTVNRVADSLRNEFTSRRMDEPGDTYGRGVGLAYAICGLINFPIGMLNMGLTLSGNPQPFLGCITTPIGLVAFVCWIVYWVKIAGYSRQLAEAELEDDFDDRPRRRRRDEYPDEGEDERYADEDRG